MRSELRDTRSRRTWEDWLDSKTRERPSRRGEIRKMKLRGGKRGEEEHGRGGGEERGKIDGEKRGKGDGAPSLYNGTAYFCCRSVN